MDDQHPNLVEADELELLSFEADSDEVSEELWDRLEAVQSLNGSKRL